MSDVVWQAIIAALLTAYLEWSRQRAASATKAVKDDLLASNAQQNTTLAAVADKVEVVHQATNGMKSELIAAATDLARNEGRAAGKAEAEAEGKANGKGQA